MEWVTKDFLEQWVSSRRNEAAAQLTARFTPALVRYAEFCGLPHEIAEDAAQDTMVAFVKALDAGKYKKDRGRLRDWIFGIATNKIQTHLKDLLRGRRVERAAPTGFWDSIPDEKAAKHTWNTESRKMKMKWCLERARTDFKSHPKTFEAFELCFSSGMSAPEVGKKLGMSGEAVRVARHRVLSHMRTLLKQFDE